MCERGFLTWNLYDGHSETSLSGAGTTGPRTSRGPDSILLLFLSLSLSFVRFLRVCLSVLSRAANTFISVSSSF